MLTVAETVARRLSGWLLGLQLSQDLLGQPTVRCLTRLSWPDSLSIDPAALSFLGDRDSLTGRDAESAAWETVAQRAYIHREAPEDVPPETARRRQQRACIHRQSLEDVPPRQELGD